MIGVFLDLKKAFDTVIHTILINKMYAYGRGNILKWFESYLTNRSQYVTYDGINTSNTSFQVWSSTGLYSKPSSLYQRYFNVSELLFTVLYAADACVLLGGKI